MARFILHWMNGKTQEVQGADIGDACRRAGIEEGCLANLDYYEYGGREIMVAAQSSCGCYFHAEQGLACKHDLVLAGVIPELEIPSKFGRFFASIRNIFEP